MQSTMIRADQLSWLLENPEKDYKALAAAYRGRFSDERKAETRQALTESVRKARDTVERCRDVRDPELRALLSKLTIQGELAGDTLRHPEMLR